MKLVSTGGLRAVVGVVTLAAALSIGALATSANAAPCDWEYGGVPEPTPEPCPDLLADDDLPLPVTGDEGPVAVEWGGVGLDFPVDFAQPVEVSDVSGPATLSVDEDLTGSVQLGAGLTVFLLAAIAVRGWASRG